MASPTLHTHDPEDRLPAAHSLREAANSDNTLEGYAAMNNPPSDSEIVQEVLHNPIDRHRQISELAYRFYLDRGGEGGSAEDDWLRAEQEIETGHNEER